MPCGHKANRLAATKRIFSKLVLEPHHTKTTMESTKAMRIELLVISKIGWG